MNCTIEEGANQICSTIQKALQRKEGALIGRNGTIELETLLFKLFSARPGEQYPQAIARKLEYNAGIFPSKQTSIDRWVFMTLESIRNCDILVAGWFKPLEEQEKILLENIKTVASRIPLRSLEPYYVDPDKRWTSFLKGHKVAIINSFANTAISQISKKEEIWPVATESLLPNDVEWIPIVTGYSPVLAQGSAEWPGEIHSWDVAVQNVVRRVLRSGARIAVIGCGGLGMLIGSELKKQGIISIVMGGAIQVLFGIKGNRWETHSVISQFWNDAWVNPSPQETPNRADMIENGCYWKKN